MRYLQKLLASTAFPDSVKFKVVVQLAASAASPRKAVLVNWIPGRKFMFGCASGKKNPNAKAMFHTLSVVVDWMDRQLTSLTTQPWKSEPSGTTMFASQLGALRPAHSHASLQIFNTFGCYHGRYSKKCVVSGRRPIGALRMLRKQLTWSGA